MPSSYRFSQHVLAQLLTYKEKKKEKRKKEKKKKETPTPTATATPNPTPAPTNVFKKSVTKYFEIDFFPIIVIDFLDHKCFPKIDDKIDNAFKHP